MQSLIFFSRHKYHNNFAMFLGILLLLVLNVLFSYVLGFEQHRRLPSRYLSDVRKLNTHLFMAGFGAKKEVKNENKILSLPTGNTKCDCNSGKIYEDCCKPLHDGTREASNLVELIRGRFTALSYGAISYLLKTTHPDNKEYVSKDDDSRLSTKKSKFTIWEKEVLRFAESYEFRNLVLENEDRDKNPSSNTEDGFVSVKLERKPKTTYEKLYDQIDEKIRCRFDPLRNSWSVVSSEMKVKPAKQQMVKDTQENQFKK